MGRKKKWTGPCAFDGCPNRPKSLGWCQTHYTRWLRHDDPAIVKPSWKERVDVLVRIMRRVDKTGPAPASRPELGPCWIFGGFLNRNGYGQVTVSPDDGRALVHRVVYQRLVGAIPEGLHLDHLCRMPACCRPEHLEPVTAAENIRRGVCGDVQRARFAAMTVCINGHPRTAENIVTHRNGKKRCRPCVNQWAAEYRSRRKEAA